MDDTLTVHWPAIEIARLPKRPFPLQSEYYSSNFKKGDNNLECSKESSIKTKNYCKKSWQQYSSFNPACNQHCSKHHVSSGY
jgi:hypothetical protein